MRVEERAQRLFSLAQEREPADGGRGWGDCIQEGEQVEWERDKEGKQVMLGSPGRVSGQPEAAAGWWYTVVAAPSPPPAAACSLACRPADVPARPDCRLHRVRQGPAAPGL